ncbi:MAG TPA: GAF domain-containing protein [Candidatus Wallbacteria bacterium]|nr:GAF domain-containing protein [Candidatus Wallbacteria bacterium]
MADLKSVFEQIKNTDSKLPPDEYVSNILTVVCAGLYYKKAMSVVFDENGSSSVIYSDERLAPSELLAASAIGLADAARSIKKTLILKSGGKITLPPGTKICVLLPLLFGKDIMGATVLYGFEKETVSDEEIEFLEQLNALIAFASMKNEYLKVNAAKLDDSGLNSIMDNISRKVL